MMFGDERVSPKIWQNIYPEPNTGCWLWGAGCTAQGYASNGRMTIHRYLLKVETGFDPPRTTYACHNCDVRPCVRPEDLYWGTAKDNSRDRNTRQGHPNSLKDRCPQGHRLVAGNLVPWKLGRGVRECLRCSRDQKAAWKLGNR